LKKKLHKNAHCPISIKPLNWQWEPLSCTHYIVTRRFTNFNSEGEELLLRSFFIKEKSATRHTRLARYST
jgi:hypothetical protein